MILCDLIKPSGQPVAFAVTLPALPEAGDYIMHQDDLCMNRMYYVHGRIMTTGEATVKVKVTEA